MSFRTSHTVWLLSATGGLMRLQYQRFVELIPPSPPSGHIAAMTLAKNLHSSSQQQLTAAVDPWSMKERNVMDNTSRSAAEMTATTPVRALYLLTSNEDGGIHHGHRLSLQTLRRGEASFRPGKSSFQPWQCCDRGRKLPHRCSERGKTKRNASPTVVPPHRSKRTTAARQLTTYLPPQHSNTGDPAAAEFRAALRCGRTGTVWLSVSVLADPIRADLVSAV